MNVVFICQAGELELKALLLAWSLRQTHGTALNLIAVCPQHEAWGEPSEQCRAALHKLNVKLVDMASPFGPRYPIGNKLTALNAAPAGEVCAYLDTDIVSLSKWSTDLLGDQLCAAKPADLGTWGNEHEWARVYELLAIPLPERRVRLTVSQNISFPYFNAGAIFTRAPEKFAPLWLEFAERLDSLTPPLENRFPWLDQIALPVVFSAMGTWRALTEYHNFPAHLRSIERRDIGLCHYHSPGVIIREPRLRHVYAEAREAMPAVAAMAKHFPAWELVDTTIQAMTARPRLPWRKATEPLNKNFLITGIPRSGTSLLTRLTDDQPNWVVLNESQEIFPALTQRPDASGIECMHQTFREKILIGEAIENKLENGVVTTDTAKKDQRTQYHPATQNQHFVLGSKNTLAYLAALRSLKNTGWPIVAMVRHPLQTLLSWRNTFDHLKTIDFANMPLYSERYHGWHAWQIHALNEIKAEKNESLRRVLFWRLLAKTILENRDSVILIRYEDLLENPEKFLQPLMLHLREGNGMKIDRVILSSRQKRIDANDREMLFDLCGAELLELGYT